MVQHYQFFVETETVRIWGDVFASDNTQAFEYVKTMFPWIADPAAKVLKWKLDWEDNRPDKDRTGIVQFHCENKTLNLHRS